MGKIKTSIYIDDELWWELKKDAAEEKKDLSKLLEEIISEGLLLDIESALEKMLEKFEKKIEFEPVPARGSISELVRRMRDEREDSLLGQ
ncbi:hypothetical protein OCC_04480 [Thermococcus litoralis DSM 5473]|uniref:CopG family transcriptional regulator n=1 Tax=Thermococcus litoralis (strain ATCC 51850 / DSM 5473 / JCM 8560 / NS-C) TaxID=523849 RepID=H3ZPP0_THELN|nr:hypothetical protein [Thermococcus litoralis]EHR78084.1 hypothetical protein OCC_04480 [Thermococcus litoralis DSM 5473]